jgi:hypothetical protein
LGWQGLLGVVVARTSLQGGGCVGDGRRGRGRRTLDFYGEQSESSDERKTRASWQPSRRKIIEHGIATKNVLSLGFCQRARVGSLELTSIWRFPIELWPTLIQISSTPIGPESSTQPRYSVYYSSSSPISSFGFAWLHNRQL